MLEKADHSNAVCEVMLQVSLLFMGHDGLVVGFEYFLPQELTMIMLLVQQVSSPAPSQTLVTSTVRKQPLEQPLPLTRSV